VTTLEMYIEVNNKRSTADKLSSSSPTFVTATTSFKAPDSTHVIRAVLRTRDSEILQFIVECVVKTDFIRCPYYRNYKGFNGDKVEDMISFWMSFRNDKGYGELRPVSCTHMDSDWKYQPGESIRCHCQEISSHLAQRCYSEEFMMAKLEDI